MDLFSDVEDYQFLLESNLFSKSTDRQSEIEEDVGLLADSSISDLIEECA
jgi:hypothetical protein